MLKFEEERYMGVAKPASGGGGGGSTPVIESLSVTPSTSAQTITAPSGTDGYSPVSVAAVTAAIDANIIAENIKKDVTILSVTGTYEGSGGGTPVIESLSVTPSTSAQTITAPSGTDGYSPVNVSAVTSSIDNNIIASNIVSGVSILGVNGSATVLNGETVNITPSTSAQTITPTSPKNGITQANVAAVTAAIDANITAGNIKKDVQILGVTGTYEGSGGGSSAPAERTVKANYYVDTSGVVHNFSGRQTISGSATTLNATQTSLTGFWNMNQAYANKSDLALVDFSAIETMNGTTNINFNQQFTGDANLTAVDFSSVTTIEGVANFEGCFWSSSNLEYIDMRNLTTVNVDNGTGMENAIFNYWIDGTKVSELNLDNLTTLAGYASLSGFIQNSLITGDYTFPKLSVLSSQYALNGAFLNSSITSVSFPALVSTSFGSYTSQFYNMLQGLTGVTVHFPSNLQSVIGSWSDVTAGFGGTNTTVLFDLTATS